MVGYRKLALLAAIAAGWAVSEAEASQMPGPFTEPAFFVYYSNNGTGLAWHRNVGFLMYFVNWRDTNPAVTVENVAWVEKWSNDGSRLMNSPDRWLPNPADPSNPIDDSIPPWSRATIPEPATALLVGGMMGIVALRRKTM